MAKIESLSGALSEIAAIATEKLRAALDTPDAPDTRTAKDLSSIIKDMAALYRELTADTSREIAVSFSEETGKSAR